MCLLWLRCTTRPINAKSTTAHTLRCVLNHTHTQRHRHNTHTHTHTHTDRHAHANRYTHTERERERERKRYMHTLLFTHLSSLCTCSIYAVDKWSMFNCGRSGWAMAKKPLAHAGQKVRARGHCDYSPVRVPLSICTKYSLTE